MQDSDKIIKTLESIDFWLGAIASNQQIANRLKAKEMGIECVWHDPNEEPWPSTAKHGESAEITKLVMGIPRHLRKKQ